MGQSNAKQNSAAIERERQRQLESELLAARDLAFVRKHAIDIAYRRERFAWDTLTAGALVAGLTIMGMVKAKPEVIIPIVPLTLAAVYSYNNSYGEDLETVKDNAERLLRESPQLVARAGGPITVAEIDRLRGKIYGST